MTKMTKLWICAGDSRERGVTLRIDWDNDRHQAVEIKSLEPEDVVQGLLGAAHLLNKERLNNKI